MNEFIVAGAAMEPAIHEFFQVVFGAAMRNGYGCSESGTGNIVTPSDVAYQRPGTAGSPMGNSAAFVDPVEGYDDPGCGEIVIGGYGVSSGYLHDPEGTKALFVDDDHFWVRTGDVGKWVDGSLVVVDRLRSIFKLAQGEYVAAEHVSQAYEDIPIIQQLYVYGDSGRICLVAVIIPRKDEVAKFLGKGTLTPEEYQAACANPALNAAILEQMTAAGKAKKLFGFQQVKGIILDSKEWTADNNFLTPTFKIRRKFLADYYRKQIDDLYAELEATRTT
jgi:long-chain acyl-CoA synthetase